MKQKMTYKVDYEGGSVAHYTHDKKEAYETFNSFVKEYGDAVRLYEAPMPINDHDEIEWETIEYFDAEDTPVNEGQPVQGEGFTELLKTIYHEIDIRCISETENVSMTDIRKIFVKHGANEPDLW